MRAAGRAATVVAGGRYDHDACGDCALRGERQRIHVVRLVHARRYRQVDYANVKGIFVSNDILQSRDDVADAPATGRIKSLDDD